MKKQIADFLHITALDWFGVLFNEKKYFPYSKYCSLEKINIAKNHLQEMDEKSLSETIEQFKEKFSEVDKRGDQIETKARTIQGFTALAGSFIVGFARFLIGNSNLNPSIQFIITIFYIFIATSLLMSLILAHKAVVTTTFRRTKVSGWLELRNRNRKAVHRRYAEDLYSSVLYNTAQNDNKGTFLSGAQDWMRNMIWLLVGFIIFLGFAMIYPVTPTTNSNVPIPVIIVTPTYTPTATLTSTPTPANLPTPTMTPIPTKAPTIMPFHNFYSDYSIDDSCLFPTCKDLEKYSKEPMSQPHSYSRILNQYDIMNVFS